MADDHKPESGGQLEAGVELANTGLSLALDGAKHDPELRGHIADFLGEHRRLLADQRHHLHEQFRQLKLRHFTERLGAVLQTFTVVAGAALLTGLGTLVWQAAHDKSLVVEAFGAPPDFAARGLRGEVLAAELIDRLQAFDRQAQSIRPAQSYRTSWDEDIKIEVPETKVSLGELRAYLRDWLGRPTHVGGDIWREGRTLHLTVRVGGRTISVEGPDDQLETLLDRAAEQTFGATSPYRYSKWLERHGREQEGLTVARTLAEGPDRFERKWALREVCVLESGFFRFRSSYDACTASLRIEPDNPQALIDRAPDDVALGWSERSLSDLNKAAAGMRRPRPDMVEESRLAYAPLTQAEAAELSGDPVGAERLYRQVLDSPNFQDVWTSVRLALPGVRAAGHDLTGARAALAELKVPLGDANRWTAHLERQPEWVVPAAAGDFAAALGALDAYEAAVTAAGDTELRARILAATRAELYARMGRLDEAQALISRTPTDCYPCLRVRARIAGLRGDRVGADRWFAEAVRQGPSLPFAQTEWAEVLLARGDTKGAIARARAAHLKSPRFADPLLVWGEALLAEGKFDAAAEKFAQAQPFAPRWGRLQLKWAEALERQGRRAEATAHRRAAAGLDLLPQERAALAVSSPRP